MSDSRVQNVENQGYLRGVRLYFDGQYDLALAELEAAAAGDRALAGMARYYRALCHRELAMAHLRAGRYEAACRRLSEAMNETGRTVELSRCLATCYARSGQLDRCAVQMELACQIDPDDVLTCVRLAQAQWQAGQRTEAYMTLSAGSRRLGGHARLHLQRGLFLAAEDRHAEARDALARAVAADRGWARAHECLALAHAALGEPAEATEAFQRALDLRPDDLMLAYQLSLAARAAVEAGRDVRVRPPKPRLLAADTQAGKLTRYITTDPDLLEALLALGDNEVDPKRLDRLLGLVRLAVERSPHFADLHYHCSRILARLGRSEQALAQAVRAVELNPKYVKGLLHLAGLHAAAGRGDQAATCYMRAIRSGADWPDVHCRLGELLARGDADGARTHLTRALELKPGYPRAADALKRLAA